MVSIESSGHVFCKTLDFYISQGGLTHKWGETWFPIMAISDYEARLKACNNPKARPAVQQPWYKGKS